MLFLVRMDVNIPHDLPAAQADEIKAREKAYAQQLQRDGRWKNLWRVVGDSAVLSGITPPNRQPTLTVLSQLPLFPFMKIHVTPLAKHPSAIA